MKNLSTNAKIEFLQQYMKEWHREWHKKDSKNIFGFRIGKKEKKGNDSRNYAIIFYVRKKKNNEDLKEKLKIPPYFIIEFPDSKIRKIETDVKERKSFKLQSGITSEVNSIYSNKFGTAGLFVTDRLNNVFMITNYHVVADRMIRNGQYYYRRPEDQNNYDVKVITSPANEILGIFEEGIISHEVDVAFVRLPIPVNSKMNELPDDNRVSGKVNVRPYPASFRGKNLVVYSYYNRNGRHGKLSDNSAVFYTRNPNIYFEDIIRISPKISKSGDSGGLVLTPKFGVLGILVGGDENSSYAIPFYKIEDFKNIFLI